jgi:hypothetical protein
MLTALQTLIQAGKASVRFGAWYSVMDVATALQTSPQTDSVVGATYVGMYVTTPRQKLFRYRLA